MVDRLPVVVDNRLRMPLEQLGDDLLTAIKAAFTHDNPKHHKIRAMGHFPGKKEPALIATWLEHAATLTLPRGGMQRLREVLAEHRQPWQTFDQRTEGDGPRGILPHNVELWDHQRAVVDAMKRTESGIVRSPTGSGKTSAVLALAAELNLTTLIIVWSKNLLMQWADRIEKELDLPRSQLGIIQGQKRIIAPITLGMQQTLAKGVGSTIAGKFGLVVLDECFEGCTPILMGDGSLKPINRVRVGDEVAVGGRVTAAMGRWHEGPMYRLGDGLATPDHPVATMRGWVEVSKICCADLLCYDPKHEQRATMRGLRRSDEKSLQGSNASPLWQKRVQEDRRMPGLQADHPAEVTRMASEHPMRNERCLEQGAGRSACLEQGADEGEQRVVTAGEPGGRKGLEGSSPSGAHGRSDIDRAEAQIRESGGAEEVPREGARIDRERENSSVRGQEARQRKAADRIGARDAVEAGAVRVRSRACGADGDEAAPRRDADALQDRPRQSRDEDRGRDRRLKSQTTATRSGGQSEGFFPPVERVDCSALPGSVRLRRGEPRVHRLGIDVAAKVHNIETENGVYIAGGVLVHNCQRAPAQSFLRVVDQFPARYRFGVSDSEKRKDGKEFLTYDLFGGVLAEVDRATIEDEGLVLPVELRIIPTAFTSQRYEKAREQHYCAHDFGADACQHCGLGRHERSQSPNFHHLLEDLINNRDRDRLIRAIVASEVAAGNQVLAFSHRVAHCRRLRDRLDDDRLSDGHGTGLLIGGEHHAGMFEASKRGLLDGSHRAAVGTIQAVGQAIDIPGLSRGILCTPITNNKQLLRQVTGRICRRADGKKDAAVYVLHDAVQSDETIKRYLRWYDRVMVHVGGDYATGEYVGAREWLKNRMQGRLEMTG